MKIHFLGTAAGGGLPQWNCACAECTHARDCGVTRAQDCLAISGDGVQWYLVNASPDLRTQLLRTPDLAPGPGMRHTPVRGVLLTSAEVDHTLGLLTLREADRLAVFATQPVLMAMPWLPVLERYTKVERQLLHSFEPSTLEGGLTVTPIPLGSHQPRYAIPQWPSHEWVIGLRFTQADGQTCVYAPGLYGVPDNFTALIDGASTVILDGTFMSAAEPSAHRIGGGAHLPIDQTLSLLRSHPGPRYLFTHLNNTNPLARADCPDRTLLASLGAEVAPEAGLVEL